MRAEGALVKAFIGTFVNKIDAKGRISVPASFRTVVQARGLTGVALYPSLTDDDASYVAESLIEVVS